MDHSPMPKLNIDGAPLCEAAALGIQACQYLVRHKWCNSPHPCGSKLQPDGSQTKMDTFLGEAEQGASIKHARQRMQGVDESDMAELDYLETLEKIAEHPEERRRHK